MRQKGYCMMELPRQAGLCHERAAEADGSVRIRQGQTPQEDGRKTRAATSGEVALAQQAAGMFMPADCKKSGVFGDAAVIYTGPNGVKEQAAHLDFPVRTVGFTVVIALEPGVHIMIKRHGPMLTKVAIPEGAACAIRADQEHAGGAYEKPNAPGNAGLANKHNQQKRLHIYVHAPGRAGKDNTTIIHAASACNGKQDGCGCALHWQSWQRGRPTKTSECAGLGLH